MRDGFLRQALTKTQKGTPFVVEAFALSAALQKVSDIRELAAVRIASLQEALVAAAGFSDKARSHLLSQPELEASLAEVLGRIAAERPADWREEIVYRFLLTRGDTLGGMMRNVTGAEASNKLTAAILRTLEAARVPHSVETSTRNRNKIVSVAWQQAGGHQRVLVFDRKPKFIDNSVDAILVEPNNRTRRGAVDLESPADYRACGELKGGIDPAGADEHWKTAQSAFERIRNRFERLRHPVPNLFFVGAAIEQKMSAQIFSQLSDGRLTYAANLTQQQQLDDLASWLVQL